MAYVDLRTDTDRFVLLLKQSAEVYEDQFEGHLQQRADNQFEQFLTNATPESAVEDAQKFPTPLRQLKDRNGKVRALGVWCSGEGYDLFVVQVLFHKDDEQQFYPYKHQFASRGSDLRERFDDRDASFLDEKATEWQARDDVLLFTPDGQ